MNIIPKITLNIKDKKLKTILTIIIILVIVFSQKLEAEQKSPNDYDQLETSESTNSHTNSEFLQVISVIDGDTFKVALNGQVETVRLIAVDTPELSHPEKPVQCFAQEAKNYMESLISNKKIQLERESKDNNRDRYGRLLRYVFLEDGTNVNNLLVKNGYAFEQTYVDGYKYQQLFKTSQKYAEENKLGLWNSKTCNGNTSNKPLEPIPTIFTPPPIR